MPSDDILRFVIVYDARFADALPKDRPLSHNRSLSQNIPLQGLSIFRLFLIMHSLIEEQIHINVRWRHQIISELICKWMGHAKFRHT